MIPHIIPIPTYNDATAVRQAISDIIHIIKHSKETNIPKFWRGDAIQQAFQQLADAISQKDAITTPAGQNQPHNHHQLLYHLHYDR